MGEYSDSPTSAMKINREKATTTEVAQLLALQQDYLTPCRKIAVESAGKVDPSIVTILADSYAGADANYARVISHEITWGEFVTENQALVTQRRAALLAAGEALARALGKPSPQTTAARWQAEAALSHWLRRQQILLQSRPHARLIQCHYDGPVLSCAPFGDDGSPKN